MLFNVDCPNVKTVVLMNSKPDGKAKNYIRCQNGSVKL